MIARILCRFGLHSWKPVFKRFHLWGERPKLSYFPADYLQKACQCRRCGKRVAL